MSEKVPQVGDVILVDDLEEGEDDPSITEIHSKVAGKDEWDVSADDDADYIISWSEEEEGWISI